MGILGINSGDRCRVFDIHGKGGVAIHAEPRRNPEQTPKRAPQSMATGMGEDGHPAPISALKKVRDFLRSDNW